MPNDRDRVSPADEEFPPEAPTSAQRRLVPCPGCKDDGGRPTGEALKQLESGTWVRERCNVCGGLLRIDRETLAAYRERLGSE